jgi:uncharacterized membrane protein YraQ (UPF0718 family)
MRTAAHAPEVTTGDRGVAERTDSHLARIVWVNLAVLFVWQGSIHIWVQNAAARNWSTVFLATVLQALPFLLLGVTLGAAIATFVPAVALARALPRRPLLAVPVAGLAGVVLPGCECSAAPVSNRLMRRGVTPAAALTFLLAAPAINPIVIVSTAVAFPGHPEMAWARFIASFLTAVIACLVWSRFGDKNLLDAHTDESIVPNRADHFVATAITDFTQAAGYLVIGAALVATLQTVEPRGLFDAVGGSGFVAILTMAALAVVLSVCSEADAFVAAGLTQFSLTARLAFLVVGPMVDIKLIALQAGVFGRRFTAQFAPLVFTIAVVTATVVGSLLL